MHTDDHSAERTFPTFGAARRMLRGSFANFLGEAIRALEHLILVPLFLWAWSDVIYGEWLVVFSVVSYISFADIGTSNFVMNRMIQRYAVGDHTGYKQTFWSAWYLYKRIIFLLLPIFFVFAFLTPFPEWFHFTRVSESSIRIAVFILGAHLLLGRLPVLCSGVYVSIGAYSRWRTLLAVRDILTVLLVAVALLLGGGFITVSGAYAAVLVLFIGFVQRDVRLRCPDIILREGKRYVDKRLARSFLVPGLFFLLIPLAQFIKMQGGIILAGSSFGGEVVALFGIHRTLANLIPRFTGILLPSMQHEITASQERRDTSKVQATHDIFVKIALAVSISLAVFLFASGQEILKVWTSSKIEFYPALWKLLLVDVVIYSVWQTSSGFQIAVNRYRRYAVVRLVSAVTGLVLAVWFVRYFGITGIVVGFLLPEVLINFTVVPYITMKVIRAPLRRFFGTLGVGGALAALLLLAGGIIETFTIHPLVRTALAGFTIAVIGSVFTFALWFRVDERALFKTLCKMPLDLFNRNLKVATKV